MGDRRLLGVGPVGLGPSQGRQPQIAYRAVRGGIAPSPDRVLVLLRASGIGFGLPGGAYGPLGSHRLGERQTGVAGGHLLRSACACEPFQRFGRPREERRVGDRPSTTEHPMRAAEFGDHPLNRPPPMFHQVKAVEQRPQAELLERRAPEGEGRIGDEQRAYSRAHMGGAGGRIRPGSGGADANQPGLAGDARRHGLMGHDRSKEQGEAGGGMSCAPRRGRDAISMTHNL